MKTKRKKSKKAIHRPALTALKAQLAYLPLSNIARFFNRARIKLNQGWQFILSVKPAWINQKYLTIELTATLSALALSLVIGFFWPRQISFSYSNSNCIFNPVFLPKTVSRRQSENFQAKFNDTISFMGYPIFSNQTCVELVEPASEGEKEKITLAPLGNGVLKKNLEINTTALPSIKSAPQENQRISVKKPVVFELNEADQVFEYALIANQRSAICSKDGVNITCELEKLELAQSITYDFELQRLFDSEPAGTIFTQKLTTVEAVQVVASTIDANAKVYTVPTDITLTLNKPGVELEGVHLFAVNGSDRQEKPITAGVDGVTVNVHLDEALPRETAFELTIDDITAQDQGFLPAPYVLPFTTSGGPVVTGINIGTSKVSPDGTITISFDSELAAGQNPANFVVLETAGGTIPVSASTNGRTISFRPASALGRCSPFTVKVLDGLESVYGVGNGRGWSYKSRVICQTVFSIGTSVRGRSITAYSFGSGGTKVVLVGATHGNEPSSSYTLSGLVNDIEANPDRLPGHLTVVIIPTLNPDGMAVGGRTNANNVDLNRNFPANDWKQGVTMPNGSYNPNGGGSAPLSEPESRALANYVTSQNTALVFTYHAIGGMVIANDAGNSRILAGTYSAKSGLSSQGEGESEGTFNYDTTGSFEVWLHDKPGIPALLIELRTFSSNEFPRQREAIWAVLDSI